MAEQIAYNIDCMEYMKSVPDKYFDLTVTSPPYDGLRDYHGYKFNYHNVLHELFRITKDGGVVVWIVNDQTINGSETGTSFKQALYAMECGFNLHDTMIWEKDSCAFPESVRYYPIFEYMFVFCKGKLKTYNPITDRKNKWGGGMRCMVLSEKQMEHYIGAAQLGRKAFVKNMDVGLMCGIYLAKKTIKQDTPRYSLIN
jgi:site-specific DNA-methyltransferase (adenine-specific)